MSYLPIEPRKKSTSYTGPAPANAPAPDSSSDAMDAYLLGGSDDSTAAPASTTKRGPLLRIVERGSATSTPAGKLTPEQEMEQWFSAGKTSQKASASSPPGASPSSPLIGNSVDVLKAITVGDLPMVKIPDVPATMSGTPVTMDPGYKSTEALLAKFQDDYLDRLQKAQPIGSNPMDYQPQYLQPISQTIAKQNAPTNGQKLAELANNVGSQTTLGQGLTRDQAMEARANADLAHPGTVLTGMFERELGTTEFGRGVLSAANEAANPFNVVSTTDPGTYASRAEAYQPTTELGRQVSGFVGGGAKALEEFGLTHKILPEAEGPSLFGAQSALSNTLPVVAGQKSPGKALADIAVNSALGAVQAPLTEVTQGLPNMSEVAPRLGNTLATNAAIGGALPLAQGVVEGEQPKGADVLGGAVGFGAFAGMSEGSGGSLGEGPAPTSAKGQFIQKMLPYAEKASAQTGIPPEFIVAQWAHESTWGTSPVSKTNNNFAGIKPWAGKGAGDDANYAGYNSLDDFAQGYADFLNKNERYGPALDAAQRGASYGRIATELKKAGWAEDPKYASKVSKMAVDVAPAVERARNAAQATAQTDSAPTGSAQPGAAPGITPEAEAATSPGAPPKPPTTSDVPTESGGAQTVQSAHPEYNDPAYWANRAIQITTSEGPAIELPDETVPAGAAGGAGAENEESQEGIQEGSQEAAPVQDQPVTTEAVQGVTDPESNRIHPDDINDVQPEAQSEAQREAIAEPVQQQSAAERIVSENAGGKRPDIDGGVQSFGDDRPDQTEGLGARESDSNSDSEGATESIARSLAEADQGRARPIDEGAEAIDRSWDSPATAAGESGGDNAVRGDVPEGRDASEVQGSVEPQEEQAAAPSQPIQFPSPVYRIRTNALTLAAHIFQYKLNHDASGSTGSLQGVDHWNEALAGVIHVWRDPDSGNLYVVNGHNRYAKAVQLGVPELNVMEIHAENAAEARNTGALINIAEGHGTAVDAAKLFREGGYTPESLAEAGIPLKGKIAADGLALSKLHPALFQKVARGEMDQGLGVTIGRELPDQQLQVQLARRIGDRDVSQRQVVELAHEMRDAPTSTAQEESLFGTNDKTESLAFERTNLKVQVADRIGKDKRNFGFLAKTDRAKDLERGGNVIDTAKNAEIATQAAQNLEVFNQLKNSSEIAPIFNTAVKDYAAARGPERTKIADDVYKAVTDKLSDLIGRATAKPEPEKPPVDPNQSMLFSTIPLVPQAIDLATRAGKEVAQGIREQSARQQAEDAANQSEINDSRAFADQLNWDRSAPAEPTNEPPAPANEPPSAEPPSAEPPQEPPTEKSDAAPPEAKVTGIRNAIVDQERENRGLPPRMAPLRQSFGQSWDTAMQHIERDQAAGANLVEDLKANNRALEPWESALLAHEQVTRQNAFDNAVDAVNAAATDAERAEAQNWLTKARDDVQEIYDVGQRAGTKSGQSLAARKMLVSDDYTLARMEAVKRAVANDGKPLSEDQAAEVKRLHDELADLKQKLDDATNGKSDAILKAYFDKLVGDIAGEAKKSARQGKTVSSFLDDQAERARQRFAARRAEGLHSQIFGLDPRDVADLAIIGAAKIAKGIAAIKEWGEDMIKEFGEGLREHLPELFEKSKQFHDANAALFEGPESKDGSPKTGSRGRSKEPATVESLLAKASDRSKDGTPSLTHKLVYDLARVHVRDGMTELADVMHAVHEDLKEHIPGLAERDVRDAFTEYGNVSHPSQETDLKKLRELRRLGQLTSAIEDAANKEAPKRTGMQRDEPTQAVRDKIKELERALRDNGIRVTSPEDQMKTALDAAKTRLRNEIEDLSSRIDSHDKLPVRKKLEYDEEATALKKRRDDMKAKYNEIFGEAQTASGKKPLTDEQRVNMATAAVRRSIADYEDRIANGVTATQKKVSKTPETPDLIHLRSRRDALRKTLQDLRKAQNPPKTPLDRYKTRLANAQKELEGRIAKNDYVKKPKNATQLDRDAELAKVKYERTRMKWEAGLEKDRMAKRTGSQKFWDGFVRVERGIKLSSPVVFGKLTVAAVTREIATPIEEGVGAIYSKLFPGIAARAPREGGASLKAEAAAKAAAFTKGMDDAMHNLKNENSDMEILHEGKRVYLPREWVDYIGMIHAGFKAPVKRAEYTRSLAKRMEWYMKQGADVDDPLVKMRITHEAYMDAKASVFMKDNALTHFWNALVQMGYSSKKYPSVGPAMARTGQFLFPMVKVSTNVALETGTYATGLATGMARVAHAYAKGLDNLKPEQADIIMRALKKGSVGAALLATGYFNPQNFGGLYLPSDKRKPGDLQANHMNLFGHDFGPWFAHTPIALMLQMGATVRRVQDRYAPDMAKGTMEAAGASAIGLLRDIPFADVVSRIAPALESPDKVATYLGEVAKSTTIPVIAQQVAQWTDTAKDQYGNPIKRKPGSILEQIEMGIPGLREQVPGQDSKTLRANYRSELIDRYRSGDKAGATRDMAAAAAKGLLAPKDVATVLQEGAKSPVQVKYEHLSLPKTIESYEQASPQERSEALGIMAKKFNDMKRSAMTPSELKEVTDRYQAALKLPTAHGRASLSVGPILPR